MRRLAFRPAILRWMLPETHTTQPTPPGGLLIPVSRNAACLADHERVLLQRSFFCVLTFLFLPGLNPLR